jgi:hypothetical protein
MAKHGLSDSVLFSRWSGMRTRCYNPNASDYHRYGGVGVTVCDEWKNDFKPFYDWAMSNGFEESLQLDKDILCDELGVSPKIYSPSTCKWVTRQENSSYSNLGFGTSVRQYSYEGVFIAQYTSIEAAGEALATTSSNISRAMRGERYGAGGFMWLIAEGPVLETITPIQLPPAGKPIVQLDRVTGNVIARHVNAIEAAKTLGVLSSSSITGVCTGSLLPSGKPRQTAYGYRWQYA